MTVPDDTAGVRVRPSDEDETGCVVISDVMDDVARVLKEAEMGPQPTPEELWTGFLTPSSPPAPRTS